MGELRQWAEDLVRSRGEGGLLSQPQHFVVGWLSSVLATKGIHEVVLGDLDGLCALGEVLNELVGNSCDLPGSMPRSWPGALLPVETEPLCELIGKQCVVRLRDRDDRG